MHTYAYEPRHALLKTHELLTTRTSMLCESLAHRRTAHVPMQAYLSTAHVPMQAYLSTAHVPMQAYLRFHVCRMCAACPSTLQSSTKT
jgi:hypothetical protein